MQVVHPQRFCPKVAALLARLEARGFVNIRFSMFVQLKKSLWSRECAWLRCWLFFLPFSKDTGVGPPSAVRRSRISGACVRGTLIRAQQELVCCGPFFGFQSYLSCVCGRGDAQRQMRVPLVSLRRRNRDCGSSSATLAIAMETAFKKAGGLGMCPSSESPRLPQAHFGCLWGANSFRTPAGGKGFKAHHDEVEAGSWMGEVQQVAPC